MSMSMSYDGVANKTCGYLGFQSNHVGATGVRLAKPSLGDRLLTLLTLAKDKAYEPMLLPALAAGLWTECLQSENYRRAVMLREIQSDIGLMDSYLQPVQKLIRQPMEFDAVHRKIVSQHAFLTNGLSEFIAELFPLTKNAMQTFRTFRRNSPQQQLQQLGQQAVPSLEALEELEEYINHMHFRARAELQHNDRMLSRLNVYLQVVSRPIIRLQPSCHLLTASNIALQSNAARSCPRNEARLLCYEEHFAIDHGLSASNGDRSKSCFIDVPEVTC
jgi:hypothetical protein